MTEAATAVYRIVMYGSPASQACLQLDILVPGNCYGGGL